MLAPTDQAYIATKKIRLYRASIPSPFRECVARLREAFPGVSILNAVYDLVPPHDIPRLTVVVELEREQRDFIGPDFLYDSNKQTRASKAFEAALSETGATGYETNGLFVIFSDFGRVARYEAAEKVGKADRDSLVKRLQVPSLWTIETILDRVDFMFFTDAQADDAPEELKSRLRLEYSALLARHDEFVYFAERPLHYYFSSKETFDRDYQSSLFYYYR